MSAALVRRLVILVCAAGIVGMIVTSIADSAGGALTFGLVTAVAAGGLILVTAVTTGPVVSPGEAEALGARVEDRVAALVRDGADETELRALVSDAVRLGRARG
jgi:hypothetical protein